jgi:hypothetical protein
MKRLETVISNTHIDSQGEQMTREALESLTSSISLSYIPVGIEHDPRIPPQGRIVSGFVRECVDGEFEAVAIMELFEDNDGIREPEDDREVVVPVLCGSGLVVSSDWTHRFEVDQSDIAEIANIFNSKPVYDLKKSADPISVLTIGGAFVLGGIATGFLGQVGVDGWSFVKERIVRIFARKENRKGEQLFVFSALLDVNQVNVEAKVILTNPTQQELDDFLMNGLQTLDKVIPIYLRNSPDIRWLTFEAKGGDVELKFAVRKDCRPLAPRASVTELMRTSK